MNVARRFAHALATDTGDPLDDPGLLPALLTRAADRVLAADGVGLSVHQKATLRTPLAAAPPRESRARQKSLSVPAFPGPVMRARAGSSPSRHATRA